MTDTSVDLEAQIRTFILNSMDQEVDISYDDRLLEKGYIPSMQLINLVGFLEDSFGVQVVPFDVMPENFESISAIADFVRSLGGPR